MVDETIIGEFRRRDGNRFRLAGGCGLNRVALMRGQGVESALELRLVEPGDGKEADTAAGAALLTGQVVEQRGAGAFKPAGGFVEQRRGNRRHVSLRRPPTCRRSGRPSANRIPGYRSARCHYIALGKTRGSIR